MEVAKLTTGAAPVARATFRLGNAKVDGIQPSRLSIRK